jgi:tetratricopeptide (TPR) repeat protein
MPVAEALWPVLRDQGAAAAVAKYRDWRAGPPGAYFFGEQQLNILGYQLLEMQRTDDAVTIFRLNAEFFPNSANVYDSLGEALAAAGKKDLAIQNYEKSLQLNPKNTGAVEALKKLRSP